MRREALWDRLYLSGIDSRAAELARENGLGLEIAAFCYAPNLEDPAVLSAVRRDMAGVERFWLHAPFAELAVPLGWQVLSVDLPEHGGRRDGAPLQLRPVSPEPSLH